MENLGAIKRRIETDKEASGKVRSVGLILLGFLLATEESGRKAIVKECEVNVFSHAMTKLLTHLAEGNKGAVMEYLAGLGVEIGGGRNLPQSIAQCTHELMREARADHVKSILTSKLSSHLTTEEYRQLLTDALAMID